MRRRPRRTTDDPSDDEREHEMAWRNFTDEPKCGIPQIERQHTYVNLGKTTTL